MGIIDQYNKSLNTYLINYERYLRKEIPFQARLEYLSDLFGIVNEKETLPYSHFKVKMTYRDKDRSKHVYTSVIKTKESEDPIIDVFDVNYTYKDKSGQQCSVNFADIMKKDLRNIYDLFSLKSRDFEQCYRSKFIRDKKEPLVYDFLGGSSDLDVEITGFFLSDEFDNIIATEDGVLIEYA